MSSSCHHFTWDRDSKGQVNRALHFCHSGSGEGRNRRLQERATNGADAVKVHPARFCHAIALPKTHLGVNPPFSTRDFSHCQAVSPVSVRIPTEQEHRMATPTGNVGPPHLTALHVEPPK